MIITRNRRRRLRRDWCQVAPFAAAATVLGAGINVGLLVTALLQAAVP